MSNTPKTIDNLGIEVSQQYADNLRKYDDNFIREAKGVSEQAGVEVSTAYFPSEFDLLLESAKRNVPWAGFPAPAAMPDIIKRVFSFQLIPSLGSEDRAEAQGQRISSIIAGATTAAGEEKLEPWETKMKMDEIEREKKVLTNFLQQLHLLNKCLIDINKGRNQYSKG